MAGSYNNASIKGSAQNCVPSSIYPLSKAQYKRKTSGPELAEHIFSVYDYDEDGDLCEKSPNDCTDHLTFDDINTQLSLPLENPNQLLSMYKDKIRKYDRAYAKMAGYALQWYNLLEDIESNEQLEKMFKDLQMMRKLYGGTP